nr:hypothetical protein [uncultured Cohaesibacter sp.]
MKKSEGLLATCAVAGLALMMMVPLAEASSVYGGSYSYSGSYSRSYSSSYSSYRSYSAGAAIVPNASGKVYLEAIYDPSLGAYVYPERISVQVDPYHGPVIYRAKRIYYEGDTPVIPAPVR